MPINSFTGGVRLVVVLPPTRGPSSKPAASIRLFSRPRDPASRATQIRFPQTIRHLVVPAFLFIALIPLAGASAAAQTAQLGGRVIDSTSAVLPGAAVSVRNVETGIIRESASNEEGYYPVPFLPPGSYTITVRLAGFKQATRDGVVLSAGDAARVDFQLELGPLHDEVRVDASASRLQRESSSLIWLSLVK
jgi:hypothetical protein